MKHILSFLLLLCSFVPAQADGQGRELSALLSSLLKLEEVHPDSVYPAIDRLEARRQQTVTPVERAVYSAALGRLYASRSHQARYAGYEDYQERAVQRFGEALADLDLLAGNSAKAWLPLIKEGKDDRYFDGDLLHVIWQAWRESSWGEMRDTAAALPHYCDLIACYQRRNNREAAFLLTLDSLDQQLISAALWQQLATDYSELPLAALAYLRLSQLPDLTQAERRAYLEEGLRRYPQCPRKAELQNALTQLSNPHFRWDGPTSVYPGKTYTWHFHTRNIQRVLIDGTPHTLPKADIIDEVEDSLLWTAPAKPGKYTLTFVPQSQAKSLHNPIKPLEQEIVVSSLQLLYHATADGVALRVVDAETGKPVPGVTLQFYKNNKQNATPYRTRRTDGEGRVTESLPADLRQRVCVRMSTAQETHLPIQYLYCYSSDWQTALADTMQHVRLFTDRAIYRSGHKVQVGGMVYRQAAWQSQVEQGTRFTLALHDAQGKEVATAEAESDDYGMFSATFDLPTDRHNGTWSVRVKGKTSTYFRVEEYKRPTFTVTLADTAILRPNLAIIQGTVRTMEDLPLRNARVTYTYHYQPQWWRATVADGSAVAPVPDDYFAGHPDTLYTDHEGRFTLSLPRDEQRVAATLSLDVLSDYGEQQHASRWYRLGDLRPQPASKPDSTLIVTCLSDTFSLGRPAHIHVTTNLPDAYLLYTLSSPSPSSLSATVPGDYFAGSLDTLLHLSDTTLCLEIPYREAYGTGATASFCLVQGERVYIRNQQLSLAHPDRQLRLRWDTFRNLTEPGSKEEWRLTLTHPDGTPAPASLLLSLYDASLEQFAQHSIHWQPDYHHRYGSSTHNTLSRPAPYCQAQDYYPQQLLKCDALSFSRFDDTYFNGLRGFYATRYTKNALYAASAAPTGSMKQMLARGAVVTEEMAETVCCDEAAEAEVEECAAPIVNYQLSIINFRKDFSETAYFTPSLKTDAEGHAQLSFTLPDCITTWRLTGFAHTRDMHSTLLQEDIVARKRLQAQLRLPRFLRPDDEAELTATVTNTTPDSMAGTATLHVLDAKTERVLLQQQLPFALSGLSDTTFRFPYVAGEGDLVVRFAAEGDTQWSNSQSSNGKCSDGEQRLLPVLPALQQFKDSRAYFVTQGTSNYTLDNLFPKHATHRLLTVEYTAHPEQYALNVLPKLAVAEGNDVLSLAAAYYAGCLAKALGQTIPDSTESYLRRILALQQEDGSFAWYPGMGGNLYLTREVGFLLTRLQMLLGRDSKVFENSRKFSKVFDSEEGKAMHQRLARRLLQDIPVPKYPSTDLLRNLYVIDAAGLKYSKQEQHKLDSLVRLVRKIQPKKLDFEGQALAAIVMQQRGDTRRAKQFVAEFRRLLVTPDAQPERGTYLEHPQGPFTSIDRKLHIHVQMMEAMQLLDPNDPLLPGMRLHLLWQKRTQVWETPVTSANAVFALTPALSLKGEGASKSPSGLSSSNTNSKTSLPAGGEGWGEEVTIYNKKKVVASLVTPADSLGYVCDTLALDDNATAPTSFRIQKQAAGISWGSVFASYMLPYTEATAASEGLSIQALPVEGAVVGSRVSMQYRLVADRDYEFVTVRLPRPATAEPVYPRSAYRWADGLGYYREVHDDCVELHLCRLPRGHYTLTEELYLERPGLYHTGIPTVRCQYAPAYSGHGADSVVQVR